MPQNENNKSFFTLKNAPNSILCVGSSDYINTLEQFWLKKGRVSIANYVSVESISNAPGVISVSTVLYAGRANIDLVSSLITVGIVSIFYLPLEVFIADRLVGLRGQLKQIIQIGHNIVKAPNWTGRRQNTELAIYKRCRGFLFFYFIFPLTTQKIRQKK